jgi:hypothetical protein
MINGRPVVIISCILTNIFYGWLLWDSEFYKKKLFKSKFKLIQSKRDYQSLINNFPYGIMIIDGNDINKIMYFNKEINSFLPVKDIEVV